MPRDVGDANTVISDLGGKYLVEGASLTANWDINEDISLKSITAWRYTDAEQDDEIDHTGIPFLHRTQTVSPQGKPRKTDQYSQEFQLTGSAVDDRLNYVAGCSTRKPPARPRSAFRLFPRLRGCECALQQPGCRQRRR